MSENKHRRYLEEIRRLTAGGKVTVFRNREWILTALAEGVTKRAIYNKLVEAEGLTIGYQQFAKLTRKLLDPRPPGSVASPEPGQQARRKRREGTREEPPSTNTQRFVHNPVPNEDELF